MERLQQIILVIFFSVLGVLPLSGQLHLKVGYSLGLFNPQQTNAILKQFNAENPWLEDDFSDLNWMSGFTIGFRNRWNAFGLELAWSNKFTKEVGEGVDPTPQQFKRTNFYRLNSYSVGIEFFPGGNFGFGGSFDATDLDILVDGTGFTERQDAVDAFSLGSHFFVSYEMKAGDYISVALRPYIQIPWGTFNVKGLESVYFPDSNEPAASFEEDMRNFGIMLIFYNGVQPN